MRFGWWAALVVLLRRASVEVSCYKAATVAHWVSYPRSGYSGKEQNAINVQMYVAHAKTAASQGAQIIVFPEYGITGEDFSSPAAVWIAEHYAEPVPEVSTRREIPCTSPELFKNNPSLVSLSCAAKAYNISIVANIVGSEHGKVYNTNIVLDTDGTFLARYRKMNLWGESALISVPLDCEKVSFLTSFGVRFGLITCADLIYEYPALDLVKEGVTDFVWPAAWSNEMADMQVMAYGQGWSFMHGVNLILSNLQMSQSSGSGIWASGRPLSYVYDVNLPTDKVIVADVPSWGSTVSGTHVSQASAVKRFDLQVMSRANWTFVDLSIGEACSGRVCCRATARDNNVKGYVLAALDGIDDDKGYISWPAQVCAVLVCKSPGRGCLSYQWPTNGNELKQLTLEMTGQNTNSVVPEVVAATDTQWEILLDSVNFSVSDVSAKLDVTASAPLQSVVAYGRVFSADRLPYSCPKEPIFL